MKNYYLFIAALFSFLLPQGIIYAQKATINDANYRPAVNQKMLIYVLSNERQQIFKKGMILEPSEQNIFWDVYTTYTKDKEILDSEIIELINAYNENFATLTNDACEKMVTKYIQLQKKDHKIRDKYYKELRQKLNTRVAARFFQIDEYITAAVRIDILDNMQLIGDEPK